jgi:hypothetical protein
MEAVLESYRQCHCNDLSPVLFGYIALFAGIVASALLAATGRRTAWLFAFLVTFAITARFYYISAYGSAAFATITVVLLVIGMLSPLDEESGGTRRSMQIAAVSMTSSGLASMVLWHVSNTTAFYAAGVALITLAVGQFVIRFAMEVSQRRLVKSVLVPLAASVVFWPMVMEADQKGTPAPFEFLAAAGLFLVAFKAPVIVTGLLMLTLKVLGTVVYLIRAFVLQVIDIIQTTLVFVWRAGVFLAKLSVIALPLLLVGVLFNEAFPETTASVLADARAGIAAVWSFVVRAVIFIVQVVAVLTAVGLGLLVFYAFATASSGGGGGGGSFSFRPPSGGSGGGSSDGSSEDDCGGDGDGLVEAIGEAVSNNL